MISPFASSVLHITYFWITFGATAVNRQTEISFWSQTNKNKVVISLAELEMLEMSSDCCDLKCPALSVDLSFCPMIKVFVSLYDFK